MQGGTVFCTRCHAPSTLPDLNAIAGTPPLPLNDPQSHAQLRLQDERPHMPTPTPRAPQAETAASLQKAAQRAAVSAGGGSGLLAGGRFFVPIGLIITWMGHLSFRGVYWIPTAFGLVFLSIGVALVIRAVVKGNHAAWLRLHGLSLTARIVSVKRMGSLNDIPIMRFDLQVFGPQGPYAASFKKFISEQQATTLVAGDTAGEIRVRANPEQLTEVILEE